MEYLSAGFPDAARATLWLLFFTGGAVSFGAAFLDLSGFRTSSWSRAEKILFSVAAGLALLALSAWIAGLLGLLGTRTPVIIASLFYMPLLFSSRTRHLFFRRPSAPWLSTPEIVMTLAAGVVLVLSWAQATLPPTAADGLSYHLTHPKMFLAEGRVYAIPYARESLWPYLVEMLFMLALPTGGTILATLFHWLFYVLSAWAIYLFCSRFIERGTGFIAALVFLMTPGAFAQSGQPYADLALAFYFFMALYAYFFYESELKNRYAWLSGVMTGAALSVKYLALGGAALWLAIFAWRSRFKPFALLLFAWGTFLIAGGWYVRSWILLGNPVYPFFHTLFGTGLESGIGLKGSGTGWLDLAKLPYTITMYPDRFGGDVLGPYALWSFPALMLGTPLLRGPWRTMAIWGAAYTVFIFTQSQNTRFFLAVVPFISVGTAVFFRHLIRGKILLRRAAVLTLAAVFAAHLGIYAYRTREAWPILSGKSGAIEYLSEYDRSRRGYDYLESALKPGERVFNAAEAKFFYARKPEAFTQDNGIFRAAQPDGINAHLAKDKYEYIWVETGFNRDIAEFAESAGYHSAFEYEFTESPHTYRYRIYRAR